jgi:hypothetical protein
MAVVGIQTLSYKELIMLYFKSFQKVNHLEFSVTWNKINNSLDFLISINYLDLDQARSHMF